MSGYIAFGLTVVVGAIITVLVVASRRERLRVYGDAWRQYNAGAFHATIEASHDERFEIVTRLAEELTTHLQKEELILFPYIVKLERSAVGGTALPQVAKAAASAAVRAKDNTFPKCRYPLGVGAILVRLNRSITNKAPAHAGAPIKIGIILVRILVKTEI